MAIVFDSFPYDNRSMDEQDWKLMFQWMRSDGILSDNDPLSTSGDLFVAPYTGLTLQVYPGLAWIQGFYFTYTTDTDNFTIDVAENLDPDDRIDLVILSLDLVGNTTDIEILEGTPAGSPVPPVLTQTNVLWQIALAQVYVASGATIIGSGDITDLREISMQGSGGASSITLANAGVGTSLVVDGAGPDLSVVGLTAGANITITPSGDDLVIAYSASSPVVSTCIVTRTAALSISAGATTVIAWNAEVYDTTSMHDNVTNNSRITVQASGVYMISFNITCLPEVCTFSLLQNGTTTLISNVYGTYINPVRFIPLVVTDYIEVVATNTHSVDAGVIEYVAGQKPLFQLVRVG